MKRLLLCLALCFTSAAQAVDVEVAAGVAKYTTRGNMMWYQEGLPHTLDLTAQTFEFGLSDSAWQSARADVRWHAAYVYIGNARSDAIATYDANYDPQTKACIGACQSQNRFTTNGHSQGLRLTLDAGYTWNGWRFGAEGGAFAYVQAFHANTYVMDGGQVAAVIRTDSDHRVRFAPVAGLNISRGSLSIAWLHYFNKAYADPSYSLWRATDTLTLRYRF